MRVSKRFGLALTAAALSAMSLQANAATTTTTAGTPKPTTTATTTTTATKPAPVKVAATTPKAVTISVSLSDKASKTPLPTDMGIGDPNAGKPSSLTVAATPATLKAGDVTIKVTNKSKTMDHDLVVVPIADAKTPLPYDATGNMVDEKAAMPVGQVADLKPGKSGSVKVTLKDGTYALISNQPGQYKAGMWKVITVKG